MKILILSFYYRPDLCAGSFRASAFVDSLKRIADEDDRIDVITTMPNRYHSYPEKAQKIERNGNVTIRRVKLPSHKSGLADQSISFMFFFLSVLKILYKQKICYDVIFTTSSRLFTAFLGTVVAGLKGGLLYIDIRDIFSDTIKSIFGKKSLIANPVISLIERVTFRSADRINLVSAGFKRYFKKVAPNGSYSFFTNGIDDDFLNKTYSDNCGDKIVITYAGNIGQGQGLEKILPQIAKYLGDEYVFWIVGDGGVKHLLTKELKSTQSDNVKLFDPVNRQKLIEIYRQSDYLFLHLNDCAAFEKVLPSKIFEYAATGKPILAGVSGYSKLFIKENIENAMLFRPCCPDDFLRKFEVFDPVVKKDRGFIEKYARQSIMDKMAQDVLSLKRMDG